MFHHDATATNSTWLHRERSATLEQTPSTSAANPRRDRVQRHPLQPIGLSSAISHRGALLTPEVASDMQRLLQFILSVVTILVVARSDDGNGTLCDFTAVIEVANEHYAGCVDLYNILEQSMPVNFTSTLCDDSDCMAAINQFRAMDLGDCIVFGSTALTSDILDQCKESKSTAWIGWVLFGITLLVFIPIVVYRAKYHRAQKAAAELDLANGKLGLNDGPYKAIDLAGTHV